MREYPRFGNRQTRTRPWVPSDPGKYIRRDPPHWQIMVLPTALTIAGSDCSGGAGIQADLKAFSANGVFGQSAIVALVDENTLGVYDIHKVPGKFVEQQIRTCLDDIGADAIKIGMLDDSGIVRTVKNTLAAYRGKVPAIDRIVLDPVMVSTSGHKLLEDSAIDVLKQEMLGFVRVITPNIPEAELLLQHKIGNASEFPDAARKLSELGNVNRTCPHKLSVLLKAGHLDDRSGQVVDYFFDADANVMHKLPHPRVESSNTHGTGCSLSSALAAHLARGESLETAARKAVEYIAEAIIVSKDRSVGKGHGPLHHFYRWW